MLKKNEEKLLHDEIVRSILYKKWKLDFDTVEINGKRVYNMLKLVPEGLKPDSKRYKKKSIVIKINTVLSYMFRPITEDIYIPENCASCIVELLDKIKKFYKIKD